VTPEVKEDRVTLKHFSAAAVAAFAVGAVSLAGAPAAGPVRFEAHDIATNYRGGYAVAVADMNKDGKPDVIPNSLSVPEVAWYENPSWTKHVIAPDTTQIVNLALGDIDGDGIPEIAYESAFAMQPANSQGLVWLAKSGGQPAGMWKTQKIDEFPTSHHIAWADLDGDGKLELLNAPLVGPKSLGPSYMQDKASVFWYDTTTWKRHLITDQIPGIIHRVRPVKWDDNGRQQFLVASFEGIVLYRPNGKGDAMTFEKVKLSSGHDSEDAPRLGASDVGVGTQNGQRFFASVEPWHGNEVVVYTGSGTNWTRRVIFDKVASGHEIAVVDLNGDGRDDIVANDNARQNGGVHVFYAPENAATGEWVYQRLENQSAMNGCVGVDMNGDHRNDIVCNGAGGTIRWYENKGM
jgi:hypothetical protein